MTGAQIKLKNNENTTETTIPGKFEMLRFCLKFKRSAKKKFYELTKDHIDKCIPKMKGKPSGYKDKPPWMTKSAKKQIRKKKCAWQRYTQSKSYNKYLQYVKARDKACKKYERLNKIMRKDLQLNAR